jgi:FMN phosphatase YigB (HAD superfamily)
VFVDWHGVLSDDPFWWTILANTGHWFHERLTAEVDALFNERRALVDTWMRGRAKARDVIATLAAPQDARCSDEYLLRRLWADCASMRIRQPVLDLVRSLPPLTLIVIATDNMDCFVESVSRILPLRDFYGVLCSSDIGVLKAEDPERFFGSLVRDHGLEPRDALLLDDSAANCEAFEEWGGRAVHFAPQADLRSLERWTRHGRVTERCSGASRSRNAVTGASTKW